MSVNSPISEALIVHYYEILLYLSDQNDMQNLTLE